MKLDRLPHRFLTTFLFGAALLATGCAVDDLESDEFDDLDESSGLDDPSLGTTEQAVVSGWTPYTSEEYPPITCDGSSLVTGVQVTGVYGDNTRLLCQPTNLTKTDSYWTPYFSEEYNSMTYCDVGYWMTGMTCQGRYCDNVSIQCSKIPNSFIQRVRGTWEISEEDPKFYFFPGEYAVGAMCTGRYCDNLRFAVAYMRLDIPDLTDRVH